MESISMKPVNMGLELNEVVPKVDEFAIETIHLSKVFGKENQIRADYLVYETIKRVRSY